MDSIMSVAYPLCSEMARKRITEPDSQEGIDCCLDCQLDICELDGDKRHVPKTYIKKLRVKQLYGDGLTKQQIAERLGTSLQTVYRHLRR